MRSVTMQVVANNGRPTKSVHIAFSSRGSSLRWWRPLANRLEDRDNAFDRPSDANERLPGLLPSKSSERSVLLRHVWSVAYIISLLILKLYPRIRCMFRNERQLWLHAALYKCIDWMWVKCKMYTWGWGNIPSIACNWASISLTEGR